MMFLTSTDKLESAIIFYTLISLSLNIGLTSYNTNGLPPFNILTSISYLPPEWNLVYILSFCILG